MKRPIPALALIALLAGLTATVALGAGLWQQYSSETRGVALGPNSIFVASNALPPLGINAALQNEPAAERKRSVKLLADGGFSVVRQRFPWREIETAKGVFQWERWDSLVDDYSAGGLQVIAVLDQPPAWSRQDNNWANRPPDNTDDFGDFIAAFAGRYRGRVEYLQVWDEPNVFPNWGNRAVDPAGYAALLAVAHDRAKQANPRAKILLAGLAPNAETGGRNMSDLLFLSQLYAGGAAPYFDVAAAKPYGLWYGPDDRQLDSGITNFARVVQWREIMVANGDSAKPIWAVEFGWNALPERLTGAPSPWGRVSPDQQAAYSLAAIRRARAEWPWLPVLVIQGHFTSLAADDPRMGFDVVDSTGAPKPLYRALSQLAARPYVSVGLHRFGGYGIDLNDSWQRSDSGVSGSPGATIRVSFAGTRLDLLVGVGPGGGVAKVSVDGKPAPKLMKADGAAWLDTRAQRERTERVTVAEGLPPGVHDLEVEVTPRAVLWPRSDDGGPGALALSAFDVVGEPDYGPLPVQFAGLALAALALLWQIARRVARWAWAPVAGWIWAGCRRMVAMVAAGVRSRWSRWDEGQRDLCALAAVLAAVGAMYLTPLPALAALPAAATVIVALRPFAGIVALIAAAPSGTLPVRVGEQTFAPAELLAVALAVALVIRRLCRHASGQGRPLLVGLTEGGCPIEGTSDRSHTIHTRKGDRFVAGIFNRSFLRAHGVAGAIVLFLIASFLSAVLADYQAEAWRELRTVIVEPLVIYLAVITVLEGRESGAQRRDNGDILRLVDVLVATGVVVSTIGLYQYFFTTDVITAEGVYRLRSLYGSPNNVGLFLGRIVPLAGCIAAVPGRRRRPYLAALALILAAITLSFSSGAWLGIGGAVLFVLLLDGTRPRALVAAGATALAGLAILLPAGRLASHMTLDQGTTAGRIFVWQGALNMLRDHPLFGVGPDNFLRHYRDHYMLPAAWREPNLSHPHNIVLDLLLRTGVIGLLAALWLIVRFFARGIELWRRQKEPIDKMLTLGLLASMVDLVVHGLVDNSLFLVDLALVFWLTYGALEVLRRRHYNITMSS